MSNLSFDWNDPIDRLFRKESISKDMGIEDPWNMLEMKFNGRYIDAGDTVSPHMVKDAPRLRWPADRSAFYTILMHNLDSPSPVEPRFREWRHWLIGNIPANRLTVGETWVEYVGATPTKGTGYHRFVFLVFKQQYKIDYDGPLISKDTQAGRRSQKAKAFQEQYELIGPVAGSYFKAKWDKCVANIFDQLASGPSWPSASGT